MGSDVDPYTARPLVPLADVGTLAAGLDHPEGICVAPDGLLYASGEAGQIYRIEGGAATVVASTGGFTLGVAADQAGRIYACDIAKRQIFRWSPGNGVIEVFSSGAEHRRFISPNWGAFGPDGTYFVSDSGGWKDRDGAIFTVRRGRTEIWTEESLDFPNGLAVTPDGRELWVLESTPGRLVRYEIARDGTAGPRAVVADLPGTVPDGLAFAADGSALIACYRPDVVLRWRADLGIQVLAHDPEGTVLAGPTNCVFYGPGLETIAVPNIGRWHVSTFDLPWLAGTPLFYPTVEQIDG